MKRYGYVHSIPPEGAAEPEPEPGGSCEVEYDACPTEIVEITPPQLDSLWRIYDLFFASGRWFAAVEDEENTFEYRLYYSDDRATWTQATGVSTTDYVESVAYAASTYVALNPGEEECYVSADGASWTTTNFPGGTGSNVQRVVAALDAWPFDFIAYDFDKPAYTSADAGATWQAVANPPAIQGLQWDIEVADSGHFFYAEPDGDYVTKLYEMTYDSGTDTFNVTIRSENLDFADDFGVSADGEWVLNVNDDYSGASVVISNRTEDFTVPLPVDLETFDARVFAWDGTHFYALYRADGVPLIRIDPTVRIWEPVGVNGFFRDADQMIYGGGEFLMAASGGALFGSNDGDVSDLISLRGNAVLELLNVETQCQYQVKIKSAYFDNSGNLGDTVTPLVIKKHPESKGVASNASGLLTGSVEVVLENTLTVTTFASGNTFIEVPAESGGGY